MEPIADVLTQTEKKLQEAQRMHLISERTTEELVKDVQTYKAKLANLITVKEVRSDLLSELNDNVVELDEQLAELRDLSGAMINDLEKSHRLCDRYRIVVDQKPKHTAQLEAQLEDIQDETTRQVTRFRDRCEILKKSIIKQLSEMEKALLHALIERDEV
ncbi:unnamed protein product [Psylliodes chrysocephalus]|uniref:Uncharacterized protein n=1 Tax=Psylliodes chrysocephalus TaxID=3402493 RepID=A0A9P0CLC3_9CUCU|nr:unnamed protein product [Psylliodes chrysocephala]